MRIKTLYLKQFRNYKEALISFGPGLNFIQGHNAQGKTSLLEAISVLSVGRSFRTDKLSDLIMDGASYFHLEALFEKEGIEHRLRVVFDGEKKAITHNQQNFSNFSSILGALPSVISAPTDVDLIIGPPEERRRLLNLHIAQSDPLYVYHLSRFNRALKQRNALLKSKTVSTLEIWDRELSESAHYLTLKRIETLKELGELSSELMATLSKDRENLRFHFAPSSHSKEDFMKLLEKNRTRELQYGYTLSGPHRDDFEILQNGKLARVYASEGQKQSIIAAIRLAEKESLKRVHNSEPIFGIDDFTNHLDSSRQSLLKEHLSYKTQTFLTTPLTDPQGEYSFLIHQAECSRLTSGDSLLKFSI